MLYIPKLKQSILSLALSLGLLLPAYAAFAQTTTTNAMTQTNCPVFMTNLYTGLQSADVTQLQAFLAVQGYFHTSPIGVFGPQTRLAVQQFQAAHGIPATGYVGTLTRAAINGMGPCNQPIPTPVPVPTPVSNAPTIQSEYPSAGSVGTTVTLVGSNFFGTNLVFFGGGEFTGIASNNGTTLSFTIPSYVSPYCPPGAMCAMWVRQVTPGSYPLYVQNQNGTSNTLTFTVTGTSGTPAINGIDAPTQLAAGQSGTWTVRTANSNSINGTNLHYSVVWGDEIIYPYVLTASPSQQPLQTSASFTHTYTQSGTYTPTFTVTNDAGQSASASATVVVSGTGVTNGQVSISSLTPTSGPAGTLVTIHGTGFDTATNYISFGISNGRHHMDNTADNVIAQAGSPDGQTLTFTVPNSGPNGILCDASNQCIAISSLLLSPGQYPVTVTSKNTVSNTLYFTLTR